MTYRPLPVRLHAVGRALRVGIRSRRALIATAVVTATAALAGTAAAEPPAISAKRAEAQHVLGEIQQLDSQLERAIQAFDAANVELDRIRGEQQLNTRHLKLARHNLKIAQEVIAERLRALYITDPTNSTLAILLGSTSLSDFINRVETVNRVGESDAQVLHTIKRFRVEVTKRGLILRQARTTQERVVAERAAARREIESGLAERQRLLSSIRGEIAQLQAEEAARQAQLKREAEARLQRQLEAQRQRQVEASSTTVVGVSAVSPEGATVAPPAQYGGVVGIAMQYLGTPYVWGGASPGGFDCSGFVMYVFSQVGVSLPHYSGAQYNYGTPVSQDQLEPGDLVFFDGLGHVGIYIGGGQFIHAPHTGDVVKISSLSDSWYAATYVGARRL
jgi:cell wall-associated NlpC family hydrolase